MLGSVGQNFQLMSNGHLITRGCPRQQRRKQHVHHVQEANYITRIKGEYFRQRFSLMLLEVYGAPFESLWVNRPRPKLIATGFPAAFTSDALPHVDIGMVHTIGHDFSFTAMT